MIKKPDWMHCYYVNPEYKANPPIVTELVQTTSCWPNQFHGKCDDGKTIYIRGKLGLSAELSNANGDLEDCLFEVDLPKHLESWHHLTIEELIAFCKEWQLPIEFKLNV